MEELVTLQYSSFTALGKRAKQDALRMGCLKRVTEGVLWGQLYLGELRRDHPGWSSTHHQEWWLFLQECLLHNAAAMQRNEQERNTRRHPHAQ